MRNMHIPSTSSVGQSNRLTMERFLILPAVAIGLPQQSRNSRSIRSFHIVQAIDGSLAPPRPRRVAGRATKCPRQMALVGEAAGNGNFDQWHFRIEEEVLGLLEAHFEQPTIWWHACIVLEAARKIADR